MVRLWETQDAAGFNYPADQWEELTMAERMTDAEYELAAANVDSLWAAYFSLRDAAQAASNRAVEAAHDLREESQAREVDRLVAEQIAARTVEGVVQ